MIWSREVWGPAVWAPGVWEGMDLPVLTVSSGGGSTRKQEFLPQYDTDASPRMSLMDFCCLAVGAGIIR